MPVCLNCEGQDFYVESGVYLCSVCNAVSQAAVQEVIDHYETPQVAPALKKKKTQSKPKKIIDKGKPWYTCEAFQVILKSQIHALIRLGCTPELLEISKQIWFKYIHKRGIAVIDPSLPSDKKTNDSCLFFRDRYLTGILGKHYLQQEMYPDLRHNSSLKMKLPTYFLTGNKRESSSASSDSPESCGFADFKYHSYRRKRKRKTKFVPTVNDDKAWRSGEEWYSLSSNTDSSESDEKVQTEMSKVFKTTPSRKMRPISTSVRSTVKRLDMMGLLSILNIALQWCNEIVTVGDLILWIRQGYLPYIDSMKCLLPHMKLSNYDIINMKDEFLPFYETVVVKTKLMVDYLEMPQNLPDVDIHKLVLRFVVEMNLPLSLVGYIDSFMKVISFEYKRQRGFRAAVYAPEAAAVALIVIVFKILFGLNDHREWEQTEPCKSHDGCCPFSWHEWSSYHLEKAAEIKKNPPSCFESSDVEAMDDIHAYAEHFKNVLVHASSYGKEINARMSVRKVRDVANAESWPFLKLNELQGSSKEMDKLQLLREFPYIQPCPPPERAMGSRCIEHFIGAAQKEEHSYVRYTDRFSRPENCFMSTPLTYKYRFKNNWPISYQPASDTHLSYDFFLSVASTVTTVDKVFIHTVTQDLETKYLAPDLKPKKKQVYLSTSWSQSRMFHNSFIPLIQTSRVQEDSHSPSKS